MSIIIPILLHRSYRCPSHRPVTFTYRPGQCHRFTIITNLNHHRCMSFTVLPGQCHRSPAITSLPSR